MKKPDCGERARLAASDSYSHIANMIEGCGCGESNERKETLFLKAEDLVAHATFAGLWLFGDVAAKIGGIAPLSDHQIAVPQIVGEGCNQVEYMPEAGLFRNADQHGYIKPGFTARRE